MSQKHIQEPQLDQDLPIRLRQSKIPDLQLESSLGSRVSLSTLVQGNAVVFVYPATGVPGKDPAPDWDAIPGAVGCTVQNLGFKMLYENFNVLGWEVVGVSSQDSTEQSEFSRRNDIPFVLLSDRDFQLAEALRLPTFQAGGRTFLKRLAMIVERGVVKKVFHPVEIPADNAATILKWLLSERKLLATELGD
jgi:peroxiredoxin